MSETVPIVMLSGMAADELLFEPQLAQFPNLHVQPWIEPRSGESIRAYGARLAKVADPGRPCIVGGASFGGIVALEMSRHLSALGCVLIGSVRSPTQLPWRWRAAWPLAWPGPDHLGIMAGLLSQVGARFLSGGAIRRRADSRRRKPLLSAGQCVPSFSGDLGRGARLCLYSRSTANSIARSRWH